MPRPKRDYGVAIRDDIGKLDSKITELLKRRVRLLRMLADYEADIAVDLTKAVHDFNSPTPSPSRPRKRRTR